MRKVPRAQSILLYAFCALLFAVIFYNTRDIIFGAPLKVKTVSDGMALDDTYLTVAGVAAHAKNLTINGRDIYTNRKGEFSEPILLAPGYNVLEVGMIDRFGKKNVKQYELVLTETDGKYTLEHAEMAARQ